MTVENTSPAIMRMMSEDWWLRRLRRHADRWKEHLHIAIGHVSKKATPYASRPTVSDWREQKRRTREFLKSMELEDDEGNRISVIDKYDHSVANPAIRRCELMNRIRGFEDICNEMGFVGEFYTLTAPSRFHATNRHATAIANGVEPARTKRSAICVMCGNAHAPSYIVKGFVSSGSVWLSRTVTARLTGICCYSCGPR